MAEAAADTAQPTSAAYLGDRALSALCELGRRYYGTHPWHTDPDPFRKLLAEVLLTRTTRKVVGRLYQRLASEYPTPHALAGAAEGDLLAVLGPAGLRSRTRRLRDLATRVAELGGVPQSREGLLALPLVGQYTADAVLLYAHRQKAFPLDSSVQRVLHRVLRGTDPGRSSPYSDRFLLDLRGHLLALYAPDSLLYLHQGLLAVAWDYCRSKPRCSGCPLADACRYVAKRAGRP